MASVVDGGVVFTIGELARRTGLPVRTIRFYSDEGLLPPTGRTRSGYRLYDHAAMARLELVKTLRELGLDLTDVRQALSGNAGVAQLAARHVDALDEQIRRMRLRRAVLRAVAKRGTELEEVNLMSKLASMPDEERRRLLDEFWDEVTAGLDVDSEFYAHLRSAKPDLPEDPSPEQLEAWIELAELVRDPGFRQAVRAMSEDHAAARAAGEQTSMAAQPDHWPEWMSRAQQALDAGKAATSPTGADLADDIAAASGVTDRAALADRIASGSDPRAQRYWQLLGMINGWPPIPTQQPAADWIVDALRASAG
jgi:DNA-binding transcriptional MerR regulator